MGLKTALNLTIQTDTYILELDCEFPDFDLEPVLVLLQLGSLGPVCFAITFQLCNTGCQLLPTVQQVTNLRIARHVSS